MTGTSNARIRAIADGVSAEMIAEQTHLFYDPKTGSGTIAFQARESLFVNNSYQPLSGTYDVLEVSIEDVALRCFGAGVDPATGADLSKISGAGMALIIKAAYDILFNERASARAAAAVAAEASAAAIAAAETSA